MAHHGESVAWNPALRPDDNNDLPAIPHEAEVTPKDPTTAITPDAPVAPEIVETSVEPTVSELDPSIDLPDTNTPDTTDSNNFPPVFENSNLDEPLGEPRNNGDEWAAQLKDSEPAQIAEEESAPQLDGGNEPQPDVEDVQAAFSQPTETPVQTADHNPNPFEDDNSSPWPNEPANQEVPQNTNGVDSGDRGFWEDPSNDDAGDDFFDQLKTQTKPIYIPPENESRFEEGVPLLDDSAAYVEGWLRTLRHDRKAIVVAAARAQRAAEWIFGRAKTLAD